MNRWLLNNEIICTLLRIHQKYFSSDKYSVDIFNAYMQEVNLFYNFQFILLTFLFRARCMHRKFQLKICGVVPSRGGVRKIIVRRTHMSPPKYFTNNFFLLATRISHATF